ncbi:hypothetical protein AMS68_002868 [Peltaster fructicola]|uniref:Cytochrome P450 n=1 Tax=Peltaster fructicola TaxID=286661 RepID=A0A6H0XRR8_9PEZI|nr:hypothetical protein AMS68_002868 [Peltaster fructicola]
MFPIATIPTFQTWPIGWAIYILTYDTVVELLRLPRDTMAYLANVLWSLLVLPQELLRTSKSSEPPYLTNGLPLLGHLWGIFTKGSGYVKMLDQKYRLPLFAMTVPGYHVYAATTPEAVRAIHKNPKTMEFTEIQKIAMRKLFYYPEEAIDTLGIHLNGDGTLKLINKPGPELDEVNEKGQVELAKQMLELNDGVVPLCLTMRRKLTLSICAALWGPDYPLLHDPHLEEDFWTWVDHFLEFADLASPRHHGVWLVMMIFSKPELLRQVRDEVAGCITADGPHHVIDTTKLKTECPILLATFRETLRHYMDFSLNRWVGDDTEVRLPSTDQIFSLKKGSIVQVASPLMQMQESIWGVDTNEFKPCRFMAKSTACPAETRTKVYGVNSRTSVPDPARPAHVTKDQKTAFSAFGGGAHVCPGRHFAFHIIAAFTAVIVSGYDIAGPDGGRLEVPETEKSLGHGIKLPHGDVDALVTRRAGYEDAEWLFSMS